MFVDVECDAVSVEKHPCTLKVQLTNPDLSSIVEDHWREIYDYLCVDSLCEHFNLQEK